MITKSRMGELKFTMLGNTATHMPEGLGGLPGMTAMATHQMRKQIHDIGVPDVPEFMAQIVDSGGHLWACRMSADVHGSPLARDVLPPPVPGRDRSEVGARRLGRGAGYAY